MPFDHTAFSHAAERLYRDGKFSTELLETDEGRALTEATYHALNSAIDYSIKTETPPELTAALRNNAFIFSGFKSYHQLREASALLTRDDGTVRAYGDFESEVKRIDEKYNTAYLRSEYNHAIHSAQMAVKWHEWQADGDEYNLQYRTAGDERVREAHAALDGVTLPPSDKFWNNYLPPNGWNCRCQVVQVLREDYPQSNSDQATEWGDACTSDPKEKIFRYNAGKELKLFPPKHPYFKLSKQDKQSVETIVDEQNDDRRITELRSQLPNNLTETEKDAIAKHNHELEKQLGICIGKPMSVEEADKQSANPKYSEDYTYHTNCQTCAPAYALRLMGFNVTAKANTPNSLSEYLSHQRSFEAWKNIDGSAVTPVLTYDWMIQHGYKTMTASRYRKYFEESCNETGVYILTIGWKGGGGHATILQRFDDGELRYIEPQHYDAKIGAKRPIDELCNNGDKDPYPKRGILRVDNKLFEEKYLSIFDK